MRRNLPPQTLRFLAAFLIALLRVKTINILRLGIVHEGVAFPGAWTLLDKRGHSNRPERGELFNDFLNRFRDRDRDIADLSADREFVGKDWFEYLLHEPNTPFRIRSNHKLSDGHSSFKVGILFQDLQMGQQKVLRHKRLLWDIGSTLRLCGSKMAIYSLLPLNLRQSRQLLIMPKDGGLKLCWGSLRRGAFV